MKEGGDEGTGVKERGKISKDCTRLITATDHKRLKNVHNLLTAACIPPKRGRKRERKKEDGKKEEGKKEGGEERERGRKREGRRAILVSSRRWTAELNFL